MAIYDLSPDVATATTLNITEDVRSPLAPIANNPISVSSTPATVLATNNLRATATIFNSGSETAFLREGSSPTVSPTSFTYPLLPNRLWEPDSNFRFYGPMQAVCAAGKTTTLQIHESVIII